MKVICLLPVRNGAHDLPGYFASVARFADAVVALDDGSTDETRALLESHPLVASVLTNPVRPDYRGWNDSANRNRLLQAAEPLAPDWIISLDADERIDEGDGVALRAFLETDALPGMAYSFRWYTMVGDLDHALPDPIWVHRLFAFAPGQRFPSQELHFAPIPTDIPRRAYLRTTFRIQHLAGLSRERRLARYEKYRQADPDVRFAYDYSALLVEPAAEGLIPWEERDPAEPPLFIGPQTELPAPGDLPRDDSPHDISIVVIDEGGESGVSRALASALQPASASVEVLLATARPARLDIAASVRVVEAGDPSRETLARAGLAAATGRRVLLLDGDLTLADGAIDHIVGAHERGFASVTGPVRNRVTGSVADAVYKRRFASLREGLPEAVVERPPAWASRARDVLASGDVDDVVVGRRLARLGYLTLRLAEPLLEFHGDSVSSARSGAAWAFRLGRRSARIRLQQGTAGAERVGEPSLVSNLAAIRRRDSRSVAATRSPHRRLIAAAERAGVLVESLTPRRGKVMRMFGRSEGLILAVASRSGEPEVALARFDLTQLSLKMVHLPASLRVRAPGGEFARLDDVLRLDDRRLTRFVAQDAIGRHLGVQIDEVLWIDADALGARFDRIVRRRRLRIGDVIAAAWELRADRSVRSSIPPRAAVLALLRLRRLAEDRVRQFCPLAAGATFHPDDGAPIRSFLDVDEVRPAARRTGL